MTVTSRRRDVVPGSIDRDLADRIRNRDEAALRETITRHAGRVLGVASRTLQDRARAEEVAQETFIALWARPDAFDPARGSLGSFLSAIAHHKAVDEVRRQVARDRATDRLIDEKGSFAEAMWAQGPETRPEVRHAVRSLSPKLRETLFLAFYIGLTYREVAMELGIPEGTAKSRIRDALQHLRTALTTT